VLRELVDRDGSALGVDVDVAREVFTSAKSASPSLGLV
jgi:hypothetical protein